MLKAITKEEMIDKNGKLDVYSFMRSTEIREYMRRNKTFDLEDTIYIILKSMNPYDIKLEALRLLATDKDLSEHDRRHALYVVKYTERILQEICHPDSPTILSVMECYTTEPIELNTYDASIHEYNNEDYYSSYQEFIEYNSKDIPEEDEELPRYETNIVYPGKDTLHNNPICFSATWFDGVIGIYSIVVEDNWGEDLGFKESITDYYWTGHAGRYSLPYPSMSKVKLQTPFMQEPLLGILESSLDGLGCWYHFFYPYTKHGLSKKLLDFSYHSLDLSDDFTVFDWLSEEEGEATAEEIRNIRLLSEKITPIASIKAECRLTIIGRINQVYVIEKTGYKGLGRVVHVELEDNTGKLTVPIHLSGSDVNWIKEAAKSDRYIKTDIITTPETDGNFDIEHTCETSLITETCYAKYIQNSNLAKEK